MLTTEIKELPLIVFCDIVNACTGSFSLNFHDFYFNKSIKPIKINCLMYFF